MYKNISLPCKRSLDKVCISVWVIKWESTDITCIPHFTDKGHFVVLFSLCNWAQYSVCISIWSSCLYLCICMYVCIIHTLKKYPQFKTTDSWFIISLRRLLNECLKWATFWLYKGKRNGELHIHCLHTIKTNYSSLRLHDFQPITLQSAEFHFYVPLY